MKDLQTVIGRSSSKTTILSVAPLKRKETLNSESTERPLQIKGPVFVIEPTGKKVTEEQLQQWRDGNANLRRPVNVEGDNIRKRVEE